MPTKEIGRREFLQASSFVVGAALIGPDIFNTLLKNTPAERVGISFNPYIYLNQLNPLLKDIDLGTASRIPEILNDPRILSPDILSSIPVDGVNFDIEAGVSQADMDKILKGTLTNNALMKAFFVNGPAGVTVDIKSNPPPNVSAASLPSMNRVLIYTLHPDWMKLNDTQKIRTSAEKFYETWQRQKSGSLGEVKGPAWFTNGEQRLMADITLILAGKINPNEWLGSYITTIAQAPELPALSTLEQSSNLAWTTNPELSYTQGAVAAFLLAIGSNKLDFNPYVNFHVQTSSNQPWQNAFNSAFGKDTAAFYAYYNQIINAIRSSNTTATPTPVKTETLTPTRTPETSIYTKTSTSFGVEFKATQEVSNAALDKAVQNFIDLTTKEPESRNRMITNKFGGYRVFGRNQKLTDLPEFSHLKGVYYNPEEPDPAKRILYDNFRGMASSSPGGVTALGEDILIDWPFMSMHESSHPRFDYGCTESQKTQWDGYYNEAKSRGLFAGTYAMNSRGEFWAEGVTSWRGDAQRVGFSPDDLKNQLKGAYDFLFERLGNPVPAVQTDIHPDQTIFKRQLIPGKDFI